MVAGIYQFDPPKKITMSTFRYPIPMTISTYEQLLGTDGEGVSGTVLLGLPGSFPPSKPNITHFLLLHMNLLENVLSGTAINPASWG